MLTQYKKYSSILGKLEKIFKTDIKYLINGGIWLTFGQLAGGLISFVLAIALANFLDPDGYGFYKYILASSALLGAISLSGLTDAVSKSAANGYDASLLEGFKKSLVWSSPMIIIALSISLYYSVNQDPRLSIGFLLIALFSPFIRALQLYDSYLVGKKDFKPKSILSVLDTLFFSSTIFLAVFFTQDPILLVIAYFIVRTLVSVSIFLFVKRKYVENYNLDSNMINYSKHLSIMTILGRISLEIDKILIFTSLGGASLAVYTIAQAPLTESTKITKIIKNLMFPKLSTRTYKELQRTLPIKTLLLASLLVSLSLLYYLLIPPIFKIAFPQYQESIRIAQILSFTLILYSSFPFSQAMLAHGKTKNLYISRIGTSVIRTLLVIILVPTFGIWGAVYSLLSAELFRSVITITLFFRK